MSTETSEQRFYRLVGQQLRKDRQSAGVTLKQLSEETGMSVSFLCELENGKRGVSTFNLWTLCNHYGSGVSAFLNAAGV